MHQAIETHWIPVTNRKPNRVKAVCNAGKVILSWDDGLNAPDNHRRAAETLARQKGWTGRWHGGAVRGNGYCFVIETGDVRDLFAIE